MIADKKLMNMFIKKKKEGGFINPAYERLNKILGIASFVIIVLIFISLLVMAFRDI